MKFIFTFHVDTAAHVNECHSTEFPVTPWTQDLVPCKCKIFPRKQVTVQQLWFHLFYFFHSHISILLLWTNFFFFAKRYPNANKLERVSLRSKRVSQSLVKINRIMLVQQKNFVTFLEIKSFCGSNQKFSRCYLLKNFLLKFRNLLTMSVVGSISSHGS